MIILIFQNITCQLLQNTFLEVITLKNKVLSMFYFYPKNYQSIRDFRSIDLLGETFGPLLRAKKVFKEKRPDIIGTTGYCTTEGWPDGASVFVGIRCPRRHTSTTTTWPARPRRGSHRRWQLPVAVCPNRRLHGLCGSCRRVTAADVWSRRVGPSPAAVNFAPLVYFSFFGWDYDGVRYVYRMDLF